MKKAKHKQTGALAKKKGKAEPSNLGIDKDLEIEDEWVIVKKQKITIIIPPSPLPVHKKRSVLKTKRRKIVHPHKHLTGDTQNLMTVPNNEEINLHFSGESMDQRPRPVQSLGVPKAGRVPAVAQRRPGLYHRPICLNVTALQNRMMRATNLERKLVKAGGLNRWLVSLDLGQFVKMFDVRNVDKFQLLSLTMEKLKDMGVNAVGPRRKLMHAIDCVNHPYCFSTS